ncbi:hypothetical protein [Streptomyces niveus]|uniref:Uncharacterized protein n=1 Tax=Streptomyces niveus TaxID=193462 RepID=A0ABZ2A1P5_STRNV|nr:hypothetical protein [Streptomyces niveus]
MFTTNESLGRLYALTGGWPLLVDRPHELHGELGNHDAVLQRLADTFTDHTEIRAFIDATAVVADPVLEAAYRSVDSYCGVDPVDTDTVVTATAYRTGDEEEARGIFACLDAPQVFDRESGLLRLEPLLRQCVTQGEGSEGAWAKPYAELDEPTVKQVSLSRRERLDRVAAVRRCAGSRVTQRSDCPRRRSPGCRIEAGAGAALCD